MITDELVLVHARALVETTAPETSESLAWLRERLHLSPTETDVLWLLLAHDLCPRARQQIRELNTENVADPTLDTVRRIVYRGPAFAAAWRELAEDSPLHRLGLVERTDRDDETPDHRRTLKASRRVLALAYGDRSLDACVARLAIPTDDVPQLAALEIDPGCVSELASALSSDRVVIVRGAPGSGRRSLCIALAREHGRDVLAIDGRRIATERAAAERELRVIARECALHDLVLLITGADALGDRIELVEELRGLVLATSSTPIARRWMRAPIAIELQLARGSKTRLWARALPAASTDDAELLASVYPLSPSLIHAVGRAAVASCGDGTMQPHHITGALRVVLDDRFAGLARRVDVVQSWDDLVLPDEQLTAVIELLARIRKRQVVYEDWGFARKLGRGLGVTALFSGPPGTGKTMCAGLIARDLGTELYQVDVSAVVSKWIGETEQNLAALFDAAESGHAVLLFDEADALFGKRTEVRSSNDRHANQQVDYLLQRLESFTGTCILTTNHETALDEAFRRRLSMHVRFPMPDPTERGRMWQALLPSAAPTDAELDLARLAEKFAMSGGYIRNAVLRAAFLAADAGTPISNDHLARAAHLEYEVMGKLVANR